MPGRANNDSVTCSHVDHSTSPAVPATEQKCVCAKVCMCGGGGHVKELLSRTLQVHRISCSNSKIILFQLMAIKQQKQVLCYKQLKYIRDEKNT